MSQPKSAIQSWYRTQSAGPLGDRKDQQSPQREEVCNGMEVQASYGPHTPRAWPCTRDTAQTRGWLSQLYIFTYFEDRLWLSTSFTSWEQLLIFCPLWPLVQPLGRVFSFTPKVRPKRTHPPWWLGSPPQLLSCPQTTGFPWATPSFCLSLLIQVDSALGSTTSLENELAFNLFLCELCLLTAIPTMLLILNSLALSPPCLSLYFIVTMLSPSSISGSHIFLNQFVQLNRVNGHREWDL